MTYRMQPPVPLPPGLNPVPWLGHGPHVPGAAWSRGKWSRGKELAMGMRLRHQDPVVPGTFAAPAAQPSRGSSIGRTLRTAWWPRFLVAGVVLGSLASRC